LERIPSAGAINRPHKHREKEMDRSSSILVEQIQLNEIASLKISKSQLKEIFGGIEDLVNLLIHNSSVTRLDLRGLTY
jgi:hypothetical protein